MSIADSNPTLPARSRGLGIALAVALALHAALLAVWLARLLRGSSAITLPLGEGVPVALVAGTTALVATAVFPRAPQRGLAALVLIGACAFVGIGAVAAVAFMALSAHVIGSALLDAVSGVDARDDGSRPVAATRILAGCCVWIGVIAASLAFRIHFPFVYFLATAASLAAFPRHTRRSLAQARGWLTAESRWSRPERACAALACVLALVHLIVVAKPEVGYDASTMHLQFAEIVAAQHRFGFDATRYAWAVMPMGADDVYLAAFLLGGERAARLVNLLFGALLCALVYALARRQASRVVALASVCVLASMPLGFLESGTLFVELAWTAFLVAGLASTLAFVEVRGVAHAAAAAMCFAGAMACKVIGAIWIAPLVVVLGYALARSEAAASRRLWLVAGVAVVIAAWPYANGWLRTGNPVFPFLNGVFASPLFPPRNFNNPLYNAPLTATTAYDLVMKSGRYIEGRDGAAGIQWLLLFPLIVAAPLVRARGIRVGVLALALGFALLVYVQQSYLRYLLPALVLLAMLGAWSLGDWVRSPSAAAALAGTAALVVAVNVWLMPSASFANATLCLRCSQDPGARRGYVADHAPLRLVADYLNRNLPDARVGFFVLNDAAPSGFVGYSRAANWHDGLAFGALAAAKSADDVAAVARRFDLTHAVFAERSPDGLDRVLLEFRDRDTTPVARIGGYVVAAITRGSRRARRPQATRARDHPGRHDVARDRVDDERREQHERRLPRQQRDE